MFKQSISNPMFRGFRELAKTKKRKLDNNTYLVVRDDGGFGIRLHETEVVIHYQDKIVLNSGGHKKVTTKDRMNRYTPFNIYQKNHKWFLEASSTFDFKDNMEIRYNPYCVYYPAWQN